MAWFDTIFRAAYAYSVTAKTLFNQVMELPKTEKQKFLAHLVKETELMEDLEELEDIEIFDHRIKENGEIPLEEALRTLKKAG
jgi:hypothetical protein